MRMIQKSIPDVYFHSIAIGDSTLADTLNGFLKPIPEQVDSLVFIVYDIKLYYCFVLTTS